MCNDYAQEIEAARVIAAMEEMKNIPPFFLYRRTHPQ